MTNGGGRTGHGKKRVVADPRPGTRAGRQTGKRAVEKSSGEVQKQRK